MGLLANPGFVAMLNGREETAAGLVATEFLWWDHPEHRLVNIGDTIKLVVDHNQTTAVTLAWQQASDYSFTKDVATLGAVTGEVSGQASKELTLTVKRSRFPDPTNEDTGNRYFRCYATGNNAPGGSGSRVGEAYSKVARVQVDRPTITDKDPIVIDGNQN